MGYGWREDWKFLNCNVGAQLVLEYIVDSIMWSYHCTKAYKRVLQDTVVELYLMRNLLFEACIACVMLFKKNVMGW